MLTLNCSFCGKHSEAVNKLIANFKDRWPRVYICNECVKVCSELLEPSTTTNSLLEQFVKS